MLHIHRSERADALADALAAILSRPDGDAFTSEIVAVPTRGMERWLTQRLSAALGARPGRADGVCANIEFPFPGRLIASAIGAAFGVEPADDPWHSERLIWPLVGVVDACLTESWIAPLTARRGPGGAARQVAVHERKLARVHRVAELYDHYATWRPAMLRAWARGELSDGSGRRLPDANAWQAELWRRLRRAIGTPSFAERLDEACVRLRERPELVRLPARIALFGLTRLPPSHLQVLCALAEHRDVNLFILHPSSALWDRLSTAGAGHQPNLPRVRDKSVRLVSNGLLASWGRDSRELQLVLSAGIGAAAEAGAGAGAGSGIGMLSSRHYALQAEPADTLLARIQADVRANRAPPGSPLPGAPDTRLELRDDDRSVQIHACHGRPRQVETLHQSILHALAEDPTLEPRDVIVMCPDIETFAPLLSATLGAAHRSDSEVSRTTSADAQRVDLRVRLADRSVRSTNPVLGVLARLIELADSRVTASQLLDLIDTDPVRRRFGFGDDDLAQIRDWILASGIHWGLDGSHRKSYRLERVPAGTWQAGLNRILLGVALDESGGRLFEQVLPIDDVGSDAIDLAGRFAELIDRVAQALQELAGPRSVERWAEAISAAADGLTACAEHDMWQRLELRGLLQALVSEAAGAAASTELALDELRTLLGQRLAGRPTRANFRTGHLTICTLVPMRSVPHRIVCLLGLDDGAFPRRAPRNGDDILLADPHIGDRDPRAEDRQMLLDALLAARQTLIATYAGNDERTNAPRPPAVVIGELLDVVDATARCGGGGGARERVLTRHPLQAFDQRNFVRGALLPGEPWSFDPVALEGAQALRGARSAPAAMLVAPLPDAGESVLALSDLVQFAQRPVLAFLRQRLGISIVERDDDVRDALPVELDALGRWGVGQRLLDELLAGLEPRAALLAEIARGTLPPGELGRAVVINDVWPAVASIHAYARAYAENAPARSVETVVAHAGARLLTGTVAGVYGNVLLTATYSRLNARHRLSAWVRLLALTAAHPEAPFGAVTIGRCAAASRSGSIGGSGSGSAGGSGPGGGSKPGEVSIAQIRPLGADAAGRRARARSLLAELVDLRTRGMREPLPLPGLTAAAYAQAAASGSPAGALAAAAAAWKSGFGTHGEDRDQEHRLVFGGEISLAELMSFAPRDGEQGNGWEGTERSRFARLARRLWAPLLASETVEQR
ncbi:MAG: exodeoxyribonuclease V subunit gamma [Solirubrobacteraceae bacterium]